ncbi:MAG: zf-HC2 domain-containing protein [Nitriliruptoraceae bacterium]
MRRRPQLPLPPEPDCHQVGAVLQSYLDGELGPEDAGIVAAHLEHCERCEIESSTVTKVISAIRRQRPDLDPGPIARLTGFIDELEREGPDRPE